MARRRSWSHRPRNAPQRRGTSAFLHTRFPGPAVNGYTATILSPPNGSTQRTLSPSILVLPTAADGLPLDIQIEWRQEIPRKNIVGVWIPDPVMVSEALAVPSGVGTLLTTPNPLPQYSSWYYRARAGSKALNKWSDWTGANRWIDLTPILGSVAGYMEMNVGVNSNARRTALAYLDMNVGVLPTGTVLRTTRYAEMNVGVLPRWKQTTSYLDLNVYPPTSAHRMASYADMDVTTDRPIPHIWWIRPEQGREGYVFHIFGHGFGAFENQYDGTVLIGNLMCQVTRWVRVPRAVLPSTVHAVGTRAVSVSPGTVTPGRYIYNAQDSATLQVGDTIEFDQKWDTTGGVALPVYATFYSGANNPGSSVGNTLTDTNGVSWTGEPAGAGNGEWVHRKFVIPASGNGSVWAGRSISSFGIMWFGTGLGALGMSIRSFVVRAANGDLKVWATNDDKHLGSMDSNYISVNGSALISAEAVQVSDTIIHGQGLDPDVITPEHGWITVVVPPGAVSAMVKVVLEGGA